MKTAAAAIATGIAVLAAVIAALWLVVGGVEVPQSVALGQQTAGEHQYRVVWPYGHHYRLELRPQTGTWDTGLTGTLAIARDGTTLFEKPITSRDNTLRITCPQVSGEVELRAGEEYTVKVDLNYPEQIGGAELRLTGLKDYRDVWMGR